MSQEPAYHTLNQQSVINLQEAETGILIITIGNVTLTQTQHSELPQAILEVLSEQYEQNVLEIKKALRELVEELRTYGTTYSQLLNEVQTLIMSRERNEGGNSRQSATVEDTFITNETEYNNLDINNPHTVNFLEPAIKAGRSANYKEGLEAQEERLDQVSKKTQGYFKKGANVIQKTRGEHGKVTLNFNSFLISSTNIANQASKDQDAPTNEQVTKPAEQF